MLPISQIWLVLSQAMLVIQTERKEREYPEQTAVGAGWFSSQRWIVTVPSALQSCEVRGVTVSVHWHLVRAAAVTAPRRKRGDGYKALFDWWTAETCLSIMSFSVTLAPNFPSFCQSLLLSQGALSRICDDEITLFLPSIVRDFLKSVLFWLHFPSHSFLSSACFSILFFPSSIAHLSFLFWFIWNAAALTAWIQHFLYLQLSCTQPLL